MEKQAFIRGLLVGVPALFISLATTLVACSSSPPAADAVPKDEVHAERTETVRGVPDRGNNPAVVALVVDDSTICTGALIAARVVLTARHCVSRLVDDFVCPATGKQVSAERPPASIDLWVGDDLQRAELRAHGQDLVVPHGVSLCNADIALVVLDQPIADIEPLEIRSLGAARGDMLRTVGFGRVTNDGPLGTKLVREHVKVDATTQWELVVGEAGCQGDTGGPALDERTGELVGVLSRGGSSCDGSDGGRVYTRADAYLALIDEALRLAANPVKVDTLDAGVPDADSGKKKDASTGKKKEGKKTPVDMGADCKRADDCAAGVCVSAHGKQYCSRTCGPNDRCPTHYHCTKSSEGPSVCVQT
jgi:hypothetical protein